MFIVETEPAAKTQAKTPPESYLEQPNCLNVTIHPQNTPSITHKCMYVREREREREERERERRGGGEREREKREREKRRERERRDREREMTTQSRMPIYQLAPENREKGEKGGGEGGDTLHSIDRQIHKYIDNRWMGRFHVSCVVCGTIYLNAVSLFLCQSEISSVLSANQRPVAECVILLHSMKIQPTSHIFIPLFLQTTRRPHPTRFRLQWMCYFFCISVAYIYF